MLTVLDEYTREALCVAVAITMAVADVLDVRYPPTAQARQARMQQFGQWSRVLSSAAPGLAPACWHPTNQDLSGLTMGERLQRAF